MTERWFDFRGVRRAGVNGPTQDAAVVKCSQCREEDFVIQNGRSRMPPDAIHRKFSQAGWAIGRKASDDMCPACVAKKVENRKERHMDKQQNKPAVVAVPPRQMSRDDRRLIFAKLEEVYVSETVGYAPGWTDEKVATDLGTPRAWVETIRDENFGPLKDNAETRKLLSEVESLETQVKAIEAKAVALLRQAQEIRKAVA